MTPDIFTDVQKLAIRESPEIWMEVFGYLEDKEKVLRRADLPNDVQQQIFRAYEWCQANNSACRVLILKSRKEGASTAATALAYHHLSNFKAEGVIIGTDNATADNLTGMLRRFAENDVFPWGCKMTWKPSVNMGEWTHGSVVKRDTALDSKAGRASTIQVVIATETAHWPNDGVRSADQVMLSLLNSMPDITNSVCILDSTANGAGGFFYETYQGASTLAERKNGRFGNGWIRVFSPWHANPQRAIHIDDRQRAEIRATMTEREKQGMILYGWQESQIAWRRETIATKCGGSEMKFDQEYPESEEVAFQVSGSPRFDLVGCARMRKMAETNFHHGKLGTIEENGGSVRFLPSPKGYLWMIEPPEPGRGYCLHADVMTGEQSAGAKVRDCHAVGIIRDGYLDGNRTWHPPELVAAIHVEDEAEPGGCRWGLTMLADRIQRLSKLYGDCIVVPEANNPGIALIELLKERHVEIWQREDPDHLNLGKKLKKSGFWTGGKTKDGVVAVLEDTIQSIGIEGKEQFICHYPRAAKEFATFVTNKDGSCGAAQGNHDDWVMSIGIALAVSAYTTYPMPVPRGDWREAGQQSSSPKGAGAVG